MSGSSRGRDAVGIATLMVVSLVTGCATTSPRTGLRDVDTMVHERVGVSPRLEEDQPPQPSSPAPSRVEWTRQALDGVIDARRAVEIALVNNATLRARAEEFGIAHADFLQANLISNPRVHAAFRFADGGGAKEASTEAGIDLEFLDVITRPLKKRMAAKQLEQAKLKLSHEVLKLAVDVKTAFFAYQATVERLELRRAVGDSMQTTVRLAERQLEAGNISALELANHRAAYQDALVELRHDEAEASVDREKLALLMGVQDVRPVQVAPRLPAIPSADPELRALETLALQQRWDLAAARREPAVLEDALRLSKLNVLAGIEVGVDSEKDFDGSHGVGPDASVPLPVFDQRQAANARIRAQMRQSRQTLAALEQEARFDVRAAWTQLTTARKDVEAYRTSLLPLRRELLEETLRRYNFMLEGVYQLLTAKQNELNAQRAYIEAEKSYWTRWAELERAVGGRIPAALAPAAPPPVASPAPEPSPDAAMPAHHHGGQH